VDGALALIDQLGCFKTIARFDDFVTLLSQQAGDAVPQDIVILGHDDAEMSRMYVFWITLNLRRFNVHRSQRCGPQ
jgi:hypothetical protein